MFLLLTGVRRIGGARPWNQWSPGVFPSLRSHRLAGRPSPLGGLSVSSLARDLLRQERAVHAYSRLRTFRPLPAAGLEFLVAGDIIKTVARAEFDSVIVLAIIVRCGRAESGIDVGSTGAGLEAALQRFGLGMASPELQIP